MEFKKEDIDCILDILYEPTSNSKDKILQEFNEQLSKLSNARDRHNYLHVLKMLNENVKNSKIKNTYHFLKYLFVALKNQEDVYKFFQMGEFILAFENEKWKTEVNERLNEEFSMPNFLLKKHILRLDDVIDAIDNSLKEDGINSNLTDLLQEVKPLIEYHDVQNTYIQLHEDWHTMNDLISGDINLKIYLIENHFMNFSADDWYKAINFEINSN